MSSLVKAITEFQGEHEGDLPFKHGDLILILEEVDSNWWKGKLGQNVGIFPVSFTREISSQFIATDDFVSDLDGDLPFTRGDIVTVIEQIDENWYRGTIDGSNGMFPSSFVTENVQQSLPSSDIDHTKCTEGDLGDDDNSANITPSTSVIPHDDGNHADSDDHSGSNNSNVSSTQTITQTVTDSPNLKKKKPPISPKPKLDPKLLQSKRVRVNQSNVGDVKIKKQHAPPVPTLHQHASSTSALKDNLTIQSQPMTGTREETTSKPKRQAPPIPSSRSISSGTIGLASTQREGIKSIVPPPLLKPKPNIGAARLNRLGSTTLKESINEEDTSNQQNLDMDLDQRNVNMTNLQDSDNSTTANSAVSMPTLPQNIQSSPDDINDKKDQEADEEISQPSATTNESSNDPSKGADSLSSLWKNWESGKIGKKKEKIPMNQDSRFRAHTVASANVASIDGMDIKQLSNRLSNAPSSTSIAKNSFVRSSQSAFRGHRNSGMTTKQPLETIEDSDSNFPQGTTL